MLKNIELFVGIKNHGHLKILNKIKSVGSVCNEISWHQSAHYYITPLTNYLASKRRFP